MNEASGEGKPFPSPSLMQAKSATIDISDIPDAFDTGLQRKHNPTSLQQIATI